MIDLKNFKRSFKYAGKGIAEVFRKEQNFRIQIIISLLIVLISFYFRITVKEAVVVIFVIVFVLVLELINSAFERMVDILSPRIHDYAKDIKNIMAAMVLIASIGAAIIGVLIFWPYLF
ncbi:MAG: diacylglycerol kinase [bacterium]